MKTRTIAALIAVPFIGIPTIALATPGPDHREFICPPVEGNGQTGYGWNYISPDKASSHIDEATGAPALGLLGGAVADFLGGEPS